MSRDDPPLATWSAPPEQIELAVAAIEASAAFRGSARHRALLRHLVTQALDGNHHALKESVIGVEVFGRGADRFDPKADSIVRVETRRLRARLARYYAGEGHDAVLRIELPVGSYVPLIARRPHERSRLDATRRARDLVERGEHFLRQAMSKASLEQAIERFDAAQRESPTHAPAFVGLARAWFNMASGWYCDPGPAGEHAIEALQRALQLDPDDATAWALLGAFQYQFEHDWPAARRSLKRAIALQPQSAFAHVAYGWQLMARGLLDEAEHELLRARALDPQYVNSRVHMAYLRMAQHRFDDAEREAEAVGDIAPGSLIAVGLAAVLALFRGDPELAIRHYERCREVAPDHPMVPISLASTHAMAGRLELAERLFADARQRFADRVLSPYVLAIYAMRCGHDEECLALLARALDERDPQAVLFAVDPVFGTLPAHPGWNALRRRVGLPSPA